MLSFSSNFGWCESPPLDGVSRTFSVGTMAEEMATPAPLSNASLKMGKIERWVFLRVGSWEEEKDEDKGRG